MDKRILIVFLIVLALSGCSVNKEGDNGMSYKQISQEEAYQIMQESSGYLILDVRTFQEYDEGHIPKAICVPNETIVDKQPAELPDLNQVILVYCRSGNRSKQAASKLVAMGYTNILEFGGINTWSYEIVIDDK